MHCIYQTSIVADQLKCSVMNVAHLCCMKMLWILSVHEALPG